MTFAVGVRRLRRSRLTGERGFTLVEMLVAIATGLVVAAAAMAFLITSIDQQNSASSRSSATSQAESGLQQMARDLRNAMYETTANQATTYPLTVSTNATTETTSVSFDIPTSTSSGETTANDGTGVSVTWTCPSAAEGSTYIGWCTRAVAGGTPQRLISGVQSMTFTPYTSAGVAQPLSTTTSSTYTNPSSLTMVLDVQDVSQLDATRSHVYRGTVNPIVLQTSADLRNFP